MLEKYFLDARRGAQHNFHKNSVKSLKLEFQGLHFVMKNACKKLDGRCLTPIESLLFSLKIKIT